MDLSDASANRPRSPGLVSDLRHGARTADADADRRAEPRTRRHDAAVLDRARARCAGVRARNGRPPARRCIEWLAQQTSNWVQFALATPVVLWAGWPFFERGWASLVSRNLNMFTLIAMGTGVAWIYSVVATLAPGAFPAAFRGQRRRGRGLFRSGGGHHRAGAARPGARTARARNDRRRDQGAARSGAEDSRGAFAPTAPTRRSRSSTSRSATSCACGPARRCRSTASSSRGAARSTSRW